MMEAFNYCNPKAAARMAKEVRENGESADFQGEMSEAFKWAM